MEEADDEIEDIQQEIKVLSQCDSAFVTRYYGSYLTVNFDLFIFKKFKGFKTLDYNGIFGWRFCT